MIHVLATSTVGIGRNSARDIPGVFGVQYVQSTTFQPIYIEYVLPTISYLTCLSALNLSKPLPLPSVI